MIRRKLTRIEVTLDDTKDLDEYFSRASNNSAIASGLVGTTGAGSTTPACSSKTPSQLYQLYTKHYSLGTTSHQATFDSSIDQQQSSLAALGTSTSTHQARAAIDNTTNYPNDSIGTLVTNLTPSGDQPQQTSDSDSLRYNPQPQNQFSRFNQNI